MGEGQSTSLGFNGKLKENRGKVIIFIFNSYFTIRIQTKMNIKVIHYKIRTTEAQLSKITLNSKPPTKHGNVP